VSHHDDSEGQRGCLVIHVLFLIVDVYDESNVIFKLIFPMG